MKRLTTIILGLLLLLSACASGGNDTSLTDEAGAATTIVANAPEGTVAPAEFAEDAERVLGTGSVLEFRKVIREVSLTLVASDTEDAFDRITALVERSGGYVADAEMNRHSDDQPPYITFTVRVPADSMSTALASIEDLADEVVSKRIGSQDVTEEYADIEAQLRNLVALEDELLVVMTEVRENPNSDADDLLIVFERVSQVRSEIERLEGRKRLVDDLVSLATIEISIQPPEASAPIVDEGWSPGQAAKDALRATVDGLQSIVDGLIWLVLGVLPLLLIAAIPLGLAFWLWRRWILKRAENQTPATSRPTPPPASTVPPEGE